MKFNYAEDAFANNDVFELEHGDLDGEVSVGEVFFTGTEHNWAKLNFLCYLLNKFNELSTSCQFVLVQALRPLQPNNTVIRCKGMWNLLRAEGFGIDSFREHVEQIEERPGGLYLYGSAFLSLSSASEYIELAERGAIDHYLIAVPQEFDRGTIRIESLTWDLNRDVSFFCEVASVNGYVLKGFGEFDDQEAGFFVFGPKSDVKLLCDLK